MPAIAPPSLTDLAAAAVLRRRPLMRIGTDILAIEEPHNIEAPNNPGSSLAGVRVSQLVDAVGYPLGGPRTGAIHTGSMNTGSMNTGAAPAVLAVERTGAALVFDPLCRRPLAVGDRPSLAVDLVRRCMGLPTPPPPHEALDLADLVWLDRILDITLEFPLGQPPRWSDFATKHPAARGTCSTTPSPEILRHQRHQWAPDWEGLRQRRIQGLEPWLNISPALAAWHDHGSFARHELARLPDPDSLLVDLPELLHRRDCDSIALALGASGR